MTRERVPALVESSVKYLQLPVTAIQIRLPRYSQMALYVLFFVFACKYRPSLTKT